MYPFQWVLYEVNSINQIKELFITFNFRSGPLYNTSLTWTKYYLLQDQLLFIYTCVHTKIFRDPQIFIRLNLNSRALLWQIYYTPSKRLPSNCIKTGNSRNLLWNEWDIGNSYIQCFTVNFQRNTSSSSQFPYI